MFSCIKDEGIRSYFTGAYLNQLMPWTGEMCEAGLGGKLFFKPNNLILMPGKSEVNNFKN